MLLPHAHLEIHTGDACTIKFTGRSLVRSLSTSTSRYFILHILSIMVAHIVVSRGGSRIYGRGCYDSILRALARAKFCVPRPLLTSFLGT